MLSVFLRQFAAPAKRLKFEVVEELRHFSLIQNAATQAHDEVALLNLDAIRRLSGHSQLPLKDDSGHFDQSSIIPNARASQDGCAA